MFDYDILQPDVLVEPEALIARGKDLRRLAFLTPIHALALKRPLLLAPETPVGDAADMMLSAGARAALVVCADSVLGLLDESCVLRLARSRGADLDGTSVWKVMTPEPPTATDTDNIARALRAFRGQRLDHLCVLRQDGSPFGILDMAALVDWMSRQLAVIVVDGVAARE